MSMEQHRGNLVSNGHFNGMKSEDVDANDLEVAMINESFEEQLKQAQLFYNSNLESIFYGEGDNNGTTDSCGLVKQHCAFPMNTEEDVKANLSPIQFLPPISPHSDFDDDDTERARQLDRELERMMLEGEEKFFFSDSPLTLQFGRDTDAKPHQQQSYYNISSITFSDQKHFFTAFESQAQQDSDCADAAEAVAINVIRSLFADECSNTTDPSSDDDDDEEMVVSASILQVLQDDEADELLGEEMDDDSKTCCEAIESKSQFRDDDIAPPPPRNDSLQTISSPMSTSCLSNDEQTVPVIDNWEELAKEPEATEKMCIEARALLNKIRAERKATQL